LELNELSYQSITVNNQGKSRRAPKDFRTLDFRWRPEGCYQKTIQLLTDAQLRHLLSHRNLQYGQWLSEWKLQPRKPRFNPVRIVLDPSPGTISSLVDRGVRDFWFKKYTEAVFFVYEQPVSARDKFGKTHQYYLLSPEDGYLVNVDICKNLSNVPARDRQRDEIFMSRHKALRLPRLVPVDVCKHLRHETTAGVLPTLSTELNDSSIL
jgi:hypothetical protein